jgi:hypothetical protein
VPEPARAPTLEERQAEAASQEPHKFADRPAIRLPVKKSGVGFGGAPEWAEYSA